MPRQAMTTAIGRGLDRATGLVAVSGASPVDVRNVYARDFKMAVRPGMGLTGYPGLSWGTDILATVGVKATLDILLVVYDRPSLEIRIYRVDPVHLTLQTLAGNGSWGFALGGATSFPVVSYDEGDGNVYFAHDEADITTRLPNIYYTPNFVAPATPGILTPLVQDLNGDGVAAPTFFRGFYAYLEYMGGWGYGSETPGDLDRGDIFRLSKPAQSTVWAPGDYVICGVRRDPILAAIACRMTSSIGTVTAVLALLKSDSAFRLVGTSPDDFGIEDLDRLFGAISSRVVCSIGDKAYTWASDGPREVTPAGTFPIGAALELVSPLPSDFPTLGPQRLAFATYDQNAALLTWCFPDIVSGAVPVPCFDLSLWNPQDPRWTFAEIQQPVTCAGRQLFRDTGAPAVPPTGYASALAFNDNGISSDVTMRTVRCAWTNNGAAGDELVQLFAKPSGGSWALQTSFSVAIGDQVASWATALPLTLYSVALRYVRGVVPAVGYEDSNPDNWTSVNAAGSKSTVTTTSDPVAWVSGLFQTPPNQVLLTWLSAQVGVPYLLEYSNDGGGTWQTLAAAVVGSTFTYPVPGAELNLTLKFRLTAEQGAVIGPTAGILSVLTTLVVGAPVLSSGTFDATTAQVTLTWVAGTNALQHLLEKSDNAGATWSTIATVAMPALTYVYPITPGEANLNVEFRVTGQNGAVSSVASNIVTVACPLVIGASAILTATAGAGGAIDAPIWFVNVTYTRGSGPVIAVQSEWSEGGLVVGTSTGFSGDGWATGLSYPAAHGTSWTVRVRSYGAGPVYGPWTAPSSPISV